MSKFYSNYCNNHQGKPDFLIKEEMNREIQKQHQYQANMTTRGKHTGSKSKRKLMFNAHRVTSLISHLYSGYNA